jgi:hypothetical protein
MERDGQRATSCLRHLPLLERHGSARGETPHIAFEGNAEEMFALCAVIGETSGEKVTGACADMAIASRLPFENWFLSVSPGDGLFRLGGGQAGLAGPYRFEHLAIQRSNSAIEFKEARAVHSFGHREPVLGRLRIFFYSAWARSLRERIDSSCAPIDFRTQASVVAPRLALGQGGPDRVVKSRPHLADELTLAIRPSAVGKQDDGNSRVQIDP